MEMNSQPGKSLAHSLKILRKDLAAIPEDSFDKCLGGKARSVADIVYELTLVNDHIGLTIRNEPLFDWPDGWIIAPEYFRTKEEVLAGYDKSAEKILETVAPWSDEDLKVKVISDGEETDRAERCRFMVIHNWYHMGQINFIQTLLGDTEWHWH